MFAVMAVGLLLKERATSATVSIVLSVLFLRGVVVGARHGRPLMRIDEARSLWEPEGRMSRERLVLDRVRAIPEGFVRAYGDLSPGAPRYAGWVLSNTEEECPGTAWCARTARWRREKATQAPGSRGRAIQRRARGHEGGPNPGPMTYATYDL